jgi:GntR family transcriptional regulator
VGGPDATRGGFLEKSPPGLAAGGKKKNKKINFFVDKIDLLLYFSITEVKMKQLDTKSFELDVDVKSAVPIYEQIKDAIKMSIFSGKLKEDDKIISIREVSSRYNINPITILKAYNQLEHDGFLYSRKGAGFYIRIDKDKFQQGREDMFKHEIARFLKRIIALGYTLENFLEELKKYMEEKKHD